ncbi:TonB-dependent siderophore receptor [Achromobacter anxifer]
MKTRNTLAAADARQTWRRAAANLGALSFSLACLLSGLPDRALAQELAVVRIEITAPALNDALLQLGQQADMQIYFQPELVQGLKAPSFAGSFTAQQALARLLQGSGIEAHWSGRNVTLQRSGAGSPSQLAPVTVFGNEYPLVTEGSEAYTMERVSMGKGQAVKDIPQTVTVVTRAQIDDQNLSNLTEVLDKTTGITVNKSGTLSGISHGNDSVFSSRGFTVSNIQLDGGASMDTAMSGFGSISQLDMAQFDHVEFLRGVDGLFSSTGEPGGTINLVRKRPMPEFQGNFSTTAGSWDYYRADGDVTGPLGLDGKLRGRIGLGQEDRKYFYDVANTRKTVIYGSVEADLTSRTLLTLGGSYQRSNGVLNVGGLPRYSNGRDLGLPRHTALTTDWSRSREDTKQLFAKLEHRINDDWSVSADALYLDVSRDSSIVYTYGAVDPVDGTGPRWYSYPANSNMQRIALNLNLKGSFDALGQRHDLIVGADYSQADSDGVQRYSLMSGTEADVFDINRPQEAGTTPGKDDHRKSTREALYGSLRIGLTDAAKLIVGGRYSFYEFSTHNTQWNPDGSVARTQNLGTRRENGVFTPYLGATYALTPNWNAYASYAETYNPQDTMLGGPLPGSPIDPVESKNYEIGVKGELIPRVNASLALYRIQRTGEGVEDPRYEMEYGIATCCYVNQGKIVSQGVDLEISGELAPGWQLTAGYTYNSNADRDGDTGRYSSITPRHLFKLWSTYRLPGQLNKWRIGGGVTAQSANYVSGTASTYNPGSGKWDGDDVPFKFSQAGYAIWSGRIEYQIDPRWSLALNANNLFDKRYYQTVGSSGFGNFYGEPRNFALTLRGRF